MWIPSFHMEFPSGIHMEHDLNSITIPDGFHLIPCGIME